MEIGRTSIEESLASAREMQAFLKEQNASQERATEINEKSLGQQREMLEAGHLTAKNMERLAEVTIAHNSLITTNVALYKETKKNIEEINALEKQRLETAKTHSETIAKQIGEGIVNPVKGLSTAFEGMIGNLAKMSIAMALLSPVLTEVGKTYGMMKEITLTGGMGIEGLSGAKGVLSSEMFTSGIIRQMPGFGNYASREEMAQGAGTMFGKGGIRGEDLGKTMDGLAMSAHDAGMKFGEVAEIMAKSHRYLKQGPEEMRDGFDIVVASAKEGGFAVGDYTKTVYNATMSMAAFGVTQIDMNRVYSEHYHLVAEGKVSESELNSFIAMEVKARKSSEEITNDLNTAALAAAAGLTNVASVLDTTKQISSALNAILNSNAKSEEEALPLSAKWNSEISQGTLNIGVLTQSAGDLTSKYRATPQAIDNFTSIVQVSAEKFHMAQTEVAKDILGMSNSLLEMGASPKESLNLALDAFNKHGDMLRLNRLHLEDYSKVVHTQMDVFGASMGGAEGKFNGLTSIVERTNMRMSELVQYTSELAKVNKQYGYDQMASNALLVAFNDQIRAGALSLGDLQAIMKGPAGATKGVQAMMVDRLQQQGGIFGRLFTSDMLENINVVLPDLQRALGGDKSAMKRLGISESEAKGAAGTYSSTFGEMIQRLSPTEGAFKEMGGALFGSNITAQGGALKAIWELSKGQGINVGDVDEGLEKRLGRSHYGANELPQLLKDINALGKVGGGGAGQTPLDTINSNVQFVADFLKSRLSLEQSKHADEAQEKVEKGWMGKEYASRALDTILKGVNLPDVMTYNADYMRWEKDERRTLRRDAALRQAFETDNENTRSKLLSEAGISPEVFSSMQSKLAIETKARQETAKGAIKEMASAADSSITRAQEVTVYSRIVLENKTDKNATAFDGKATQK